MSKAENEIRRDRLQIMQDLKDEHEQLIRMAQLASQQPTHKSTRKNLKNDESASHKNKAKKRKKSKSKKSKKHKRNCDDESDSDSTSSKPRKLIEREKKTKSSKNAKSSETFGERKREKKKKRKHSEMETSSSESDEWIEKGNQSQAQVRSISEWMAEDFCLKTFSNIKNDNEKNVPSESYNPRQDKRELNTYWKTTGTGLPATFLKPKDYDDEIDNSSQFHKQEVLGVNTFSRRSWQKYRPNEREEKDNMPLEENINSNANEAMQEQDERIEQTKETNEGKYFTDRELNELGAKIVKAELLGNTDLAKELQKKLDMARNQRKICTDKRKEESFVPAEERAVSIKRGNSMKYNDPYGGRGKKSATEIERCVNFMDEKYDIKEMFIGEKSSTGGNNYQNVCNDEITGGNSRYSTKLNDCNKCLNDDRMDKSAIVCIGEYSYLALPWHVGLQPGHCILAPIQHTSCSTLLDENVWEEITNFRKALTEMYAAQKKDVIFFEIAKRCRSDAHLNIHCVPINGNEAEIAPFCFKKAIEESEHEWSINKQLIKLQNNKNVRNSIPKGVPYFWVNFGMTNGFAHVIEDQECFPPNFAQKIIGGFLNLEPQKWRRPQKEHNLATKAKTFGDLWDIYNFLDTERKEKNI